ncbi:MAG: 50S ribosomal protein L9 [Patescibacteria group bacterium]
MKVKLNKHVAGLGSAGDVKDVKEGYAQNYLFPNKLAHAVDKSTAVTITQQKVVQKKVKKTSVDLKGVSITINMESNESGGLYSSVDKEQVSRALQKQFPGVMIKKMKPAHLKEVGDHKVSVTVQNKTYDIHVNITSS